MFYVYCNGELEVACESVDKLLKELKLCGVVGDQLLWFMFWLGRDKKCDAETQYLNYDGKRCFMYVLVYYAEDHRPNGLPF